MEMDWCTVSFSHPITVSQNQFIIFQGIPEHLILPMLLKCSFVMETNSKEKQEHVGSRWRIYILYWLFPHTVSLHVCFWLLSNSILGWVDIWTNLECLLRK